MPIRNPFKRSTGATEQPQDDSRSTYQGGTDRGLQTAKPIQIQEPIEYKLSGMSTRIMLLQISLAILSYACSVPELLTS